MNLGDFLWSLVVIFFMVVYFMILFRILIDLFSDHETSGVMKAVWIVFLLFLPLITMLVYVIVRGDGMNKRAMAQMAEAQKAQDQYIKQVASSTDPATQIAKAQELLSSGAITQAEFDSLKAKALA